MIFQDLLLLQVSSLSALDEFVTVVFITHFQVVEGVYQGFDFLLAFSKFAVEFVTVSLELFLLLGCLDDIVCLRVVSWRLGVA